MRDFLYSEYEKNIMKREMISFAKMGADGIVLGLLDRDGKLDVAAMREMIQEVRNINPCIKITLHRAFDMCQDPVESLRQAENLQMDTILTSGQKNSCLDGAQLLRELIEKSKKDVRITIMAGGGIHGPEDVKYLYQIGIRSFHLSGKKTYESGMIYRNKEVTMGLECASEYSLWRTDAQVIRQIAELKR